MATMIDFKDGEQVVGHVEIDSGSLILADGIAESDFKLDARNKVTIDLKLDKVSLPVIAAQQDGRRYLLIPLDAATPQINAAGETVKMEDKADMPKEEKKESDKK